MEKTKDIQLTPEFLGDLIKKTRLSLDLSQDELGNNLDVGKSHISKLESGSKKNLSIQDLINIFESMGGEVIISIKDKDGDEVFDTRNKSRKKRGARRRCLTLPKVEVVAV